MCPAHGKRSIGSGISVSITSRRGMSAFTSRFVEIGERGGEAPRAEAGGERPQAGQRELRLHAALRREQFVPFVDDHGLEAGKNVVGVVE